MDPQGKPGVLRAGSSVELTGSNSDSRKSSPSPVRSDLPSLFSQLRTNDSKAQLKKSKDNQTYEANSTSSFGSVSDASFSTPYIYAQGLNESLNKVATSGSLDSNSENSQQDGTPEFTATSVNLPQIFLKEGMLLLKVSHKSKKQVLLRLDPENFSLHWVATSSRPKSREIAMDSIRNCLFQEDATNYREELHISKEFESMWVSIFYFNGKKKKLKSLHLIAGSERDFRRLTQLVNYLERYRNYLDKNLLLDYTLDAKEKKMLTFEDVLKFSKRFNMNISKQHLSKVYKQVVNDTSVSLNFEQFKEFVSILKVRDDILKIYMEICGQNNVMTYGIFKNFVLEIQQEKYENEQIWKIFQLFKSGYDYLTPENFNHFLLSKYCNVMEFSFFKNENNHYFDKPLNEYYISSSHNTYLLGRQLVGASSIEGYIKVLQKGCRCVEIDVWDGDVENSNGDNLDEPMVSHGRTFTTAISFSNVIKTIKKYAFITTPYPLILSLEIKCSESNQLKMITILKNVLGDSLITEPIDQGFELPSPNQLKHKILIKSKRTQPSSKVGISDSGKYYSTSTTTTSFSEDNSSDKSTRSRSSSFAIKKSKVVAVCEPMSDLGVYLSGIKFRNFSLPESKTFNHCFSLNEKAVNSMLKDDVKKLQLDKHNRRFFMRVYPSKFRLMSSNFIPINFWANGVQMVATNWQTYDLGQQINEALFDGINRRGYLMKPIELRKPFLKSMRPVESTPKKLWFNIEVVSGHHLPKSNHGVINPFVQCEIFGANDVKWNDISPIKKTNTVIQNGYNPIWNHKFSGVITSSHDLVFIRFLVNSDEDEVNNIGLFIGQLTALKKGYRYLPLNDMSGEELIYSKIFVRLDYGNLTQVH